MNKVIRNTIDNKDERFQIGDLIFIHTTFSDIPVIIAQVNCGEVAAITLTEGNRWTTAIQVPDIEDIDFETMLLVTNGKKFERINSVTITRKK